MGQRFSTASLLRREEPYTIKDFYDGTAEEVQEFFDVIEATELDLITNPAKVMVGWYNLMGVQCDPVGLEEGTVLYEVNNFSLALQQFFDHRDGLREEGTVIPPTEQDILFVMSMCDQLNVDSDEFADYVYQLGEEGNEKEESMIDDLLVEMGLVDIPEEAMDA